jgi:hypothetical protein
LKLFQFKNFIDLQWTLPLNVRNIFGNKMKVWLWKFIIFFLIFITYLLCLLSIISKIVNKIKLNWWITDPCDYVSHLKKIIKITLELTIYLVR